MNNSRYAFAAAVMYAAATSLTPTPASAENTESTNTITEDSGFVVFSDDDGQIQGVFFPKSGSEPRIIFDQNKTGGAVSSVPGSYKSAIGVFSKDCALNQDLETGEAHVICKPSEDGLAI